MSRPPSCHATGAQLDDIRIHDNRAGSRFTRDAGSAEVKGLKRNGNDRTSRKREQKRALGTATHEAPEAMGNKMTKVADLSHR